MKLLTKILILIISCFSLTLQGQTQDIDPNLNSNNLNSILDALPTISKDSTKTEITAHVDAMIKLMNEEHYKANYAPILIYADKGLALAKMSSNANHIHDTRGVVGNTLIKVKDSVKAKKLFLKTLAYAEKTNDSSLILKSKANLANIYYYKEGQKNITIRIYLESVELAERLKDTTRLFILHHNLARAFNEVNNPDSSNYHIEKTAFYLNAIGNPPHFQASHFHNVGRRFLLLNKADEAIENFKKTIALCENTDFVEALVEGYTGYREALELKKDYKEFYKINKILKVYEEGREESEAKNIIDAVNAKLNVERYKNQIKTNELEKELLVEQAERRNTFFILAIATVAFLILILVITYVSSKRRKALVEDLKIKNKQYLIAKKESEEFAKTKTKFFATVSHELRTPLYGVIGLSSILLENEDLKKHEKDLKSLKFSANYLLTLVNDLLHINKIENKNFIDEDITFNLKTLTTRIVSSFEYITLQHQNEISVTLHKEVPLLLKCNSVRLSQILMNLIGNACKFTEKGKIDITIELLEKTDTVAKLKFTIKDTGPGIEKTKLDHVFNEFAQIDSSSSAYQGTGLGLPIVKKLIEQANGTIAVESELGKGSTFTFTLSMLISNETLEQNMSPILDFKQLQHKRVLIVEDNRINQTVTKRILDSEGVVCSIAENGEKAVSAVKQSTFDLILMDINMPVKNGIEATKDIRQFNTTIPIIALTAVDIEEQKNQIFECGMNDIILKPYDIDLFKKTIASNLNSKLETEL
ncbi:ATP-binding protein [uncultured Kordia sp.]|uniref:ATP-binding protein n=1 Tax=uncultured Kordia sp. TaxID=507699 RepID=UPI0026378A7D|nr:ATP-binding protein [uncultured Kordia sp.]